MKREQTIHCSNENEWKNLIVDLYHDGRKFIAQRYALIIRLLDTKEDTP
jgi:hypothetical protein